MKRYLLIVLIIVIAVASFQLNPLRFGDKYIENMILKRIPYKTNFVVAKKIVEESKWGIEYIDEKNGYELYGDQGWTVLGEKYMRVYLGEYRSFFVTDVSAFLIFDDCSELIHIVIKKETDSF